MASVNYRIAVRQARGRTGMLRLQRGVRGAGEVRRLRAAIAIVHDPCRAGAGAKIVTRAGASHARMAGACRKMRLTMIRPRLPRLGRNAEADRHAQATRGCCLGGTCLASADVRGHTGRDRRARCRHAGNRSDRRAPPQLSRFADSPIPPTTPAQRRLE